jgi:hypothetical protein
MVVSHITVPAPDVCTGDHTFGVSTGAGAAVPAGAGATDVGGGALEVGGGVGAGVEEVRRMVVESAGRAAVDVAAPGAGWRTVVVVARWPDDEQAARSAAQLPASTVSRILAHVDAMAPSLLVTRRRVGGGG